MHDEPSTGVEVLRDGAILELRLNGPSRRNALGIEQARCLYGAIQGANEDPGVHAIVVTASPPCFCAGGDLDMLEEMVARGPQAVRESIYGIFQGLFRCIEEAAVPIVAAVEGAANGVGADLALAADVTFIGPTGWLSQGWRRLGLVAATGGTEYVQRRAGRSGVWRFLAEDRVESRQAQEMGLAVSVPDAAESARQLATSLGAIPRPQLTAVRTLTRTRSLDEHLHAALDYQVGFLSGEDFRRRCARLRNRPDNR